MSSVPLLLALLLVAYVGSQLMGGRTGSYRLASGAEYLLLGLALGPLALGAAERSTLDAFRPLAIFGTAWFTLVIGAEYGYGDRGRIGFKGFALGALVALLTAIGIAAAAYGVVGRFTPFHGRELQLVAAGIGLVGSETTRHAVRLVVGRGAAEGKLSRLVADLADADDVIPILGIAVLFPAMDPPAATIRLPFWAWGMVTLAIGVVLGGIAAALLRSELRASEGWGVLLGATLFGAGISWRLGLAPQATTFVLGISLAFLSRHRKELRAMLGRSEQAVLLPTLLLAGAEVQVAGPRGLLALLLAAFAVRALVRFVGASAVTALARAPAVVAPPLALGLLTSGALSIVLGLAFSSRFSGPVGDAILAVAVGLAILGEAVGPAALRRALVRAGDIKEPLGATANPAALDVPPTPEPLREPNS